MQYFTIIFGIIRMLFLIWEKSINDKKKKKRLGTDRYTSL